MGSFYPFMTDGEAERQQVSLVCSTSHIRIKAELRVSPVIQAPKSLLFAIQHTCFMLCHPKYYGALFSAFLYFFYSLHLLFILSFPAPSLLTPVFISHFFSFLFIPLLPTPALPFILLLEIYN